MGFGIPAALGAAIAAPDRPVICFTGDGSALMNIQELATLAETRTNVKIVLFDNNSLGLVRQQQNLFYGSRFHASDFCSEPDFCTIAQAFGLAAADLGAWDAGTSADLATALAAPGPALIRIELHREELVFPMVAPGAANTNMITSGEACPSNPKNAA
jgi:acetolactate synthase-1/2/3 large subunit